MKVTILWIIPISLFSAKCLACGAPVRLATKSVQLVKTLPEMTLASVKDTKWEQVQARMKAKAQVRQK